MNKQFVMSSDNIIPIDSQFERFKNHLSFNDRIIFSARFGDGKTYFLKEFFNKFHEEFEVIQIFPVNYQLEKNGDVFELIKKNILIHLLANDYIQDENVFDESIYFQYFLLNNGADIILDLLKCVQKIKVPVSIVDKVVSYFKKYSKRKKSLKKTTAQNVEEYLRNFEFKSGVYEYDYYSGVITSCIERIKSKGKKVIFLVEDMDRLDPGQFFRILNVLTAHIDLQNRIYSKVDISTFKNKFSFDKVILVFDFLKTKSLFKHFYGVDADFEGYISKFSNAKPFNYSIKGVSVEYCMGLISRLLGIGIDRLKSIRLILEALNGLTIREMVSVFERVDNQIIQDPVTCKEDLKLNPLNPFLRFNVICTRLNVNASTILSELFKENHILFYNFIGVNWLLEPRVNFFHSNIIRIPIGDHNQMSESLQLGVEVKREGDFVKELLFSKHDNMVNYNKLNYIVGQIVGEAKQYIKT